MESAIVLLFEMDYGKFQHVFPLVIQTQLQYGIITTECTIGSSVDTRTQCLCAHACFSCRVYVATHVVMTCLTFQGKTLLLWTDELLYKGLKSEVDIGRSK